LTTPVISAEVWPSADVTNWTVYSLLSDELDQFLLRDLRDILHGR